MLNIKPAELSHHKAISKLHAENWRQHYRGIMSDTFLAGRVQQDRLEFWQQRLHAPVANQRVIIALLNETLAGFACLYLNDNETYGTLLDNLHVDTHYRGLGIGKKLITDCAGQVCKEGNGKLYLYVYEKNKVARRFYENLSGIHTETFNEQTVDGMNVMVCRYAWPDASVIIG